MPQEMQLALFDKNTQKPSPSANTLDAPNGAQQASTHAEVSAEASSAAPSVSESGDVHLPPATEELVLQNSALDGSGIVATHDEALGTMEPSVQDTAAPESKQTYVSPRTRAPKGVASKPTHVAPSASKPAPTASAHSQPHQGLSVKQVAALFSVSVATIWSWSKYNPEFPKPAKLSQGVTRWRVADIIAFQTKFWGE